MSSELKHLEFVKIAAMQSFVIVSSLYEFAKKNSGPLKPAVGTVENAVTNVVSPVFDKFMDVPNNILAFFDEKVDEVAQKFDEIAPSTAKKLVNKAYGLIQTAVEKADKLGEEVKERGPRAGFEYAAKESKQIFVAETVKGWILLEQNSTFNKVGGFALQTAKKCAVEYNYAVNDFRGKDFTLFSYLPLVPVDEIKKAYEAEKNGAANDAPSSPAVNETTPTPDVAAKDE